MEDFLLQAATAAVALLLEALVLQLIRRMLGTITGEPRHEASGIRCQDYWIRHLPWSPAA
jgi:hypothetical protein